MALHSLNGALSLALFAETAKREGPDFVQARKSGRLTLKEGTSFNVACGANTVLVADAFAKMDPDSFSDIQGGRRK